jgi:hypothetical protein
LSPYALSTAHDCATTDQSRSIATFIPVFARFRRLENEMVKTRMVHVEIMAPIELLPWNESCATVYRGPKSTVRYQLCPEGFMVVLINNP